MTDRRQAFRREPLEVDLGDDRIIIVDPLPWEARNDFGNQLVYQHTQITNEAVRLYVDPDTQVPQLEAKLGEKFTDPKRLLELGLSSGAFEVAYSKPLYRNQLTEILLAILDINELEQLKPMIDPKLQNWRIRPRIQRGD